MADPNDFDGDGGQGACERLSQVAEGMLTINLNGWFTKINREGLTQGHGQGKPRHIALYSTIRRHNLTLVGVQEHHWGSLARSAEARFWLRQKGWSMTETCGEGREGVALLWKSSQWAEISSFALHPRLLFVELEHISGDRMLFLVGHFYNDPVSRRQQWQDLSLFCRTKCLKVDVSLCDHNSILHAGATSAEAAVLSSPEKRAVEVEDAVHLEWRMVDAWDSVHGEDMDSPGYTHTYHRLGTTIERRIDRIMFRQDLLPFISSSYTLPVGFSDHLGVVCWLRAVGDEDGKGERRWKFNVGVLNDPDLRERIQQELSRVTSPSFAGWEEGIHILRKHSLKFSAKQSERSPMWREVSLLLRDSHPGFVPRRAWHLFHQKGIQVSSMGQAYSALRRIALEVEHEVQRGLTLDALRTSLQTHDSLMRARRQRDKAVARMLQELQSRRTLATIQNRQGHLVSGGVPVASVLKEFWESVTPDHMPGARQCAAWLDRLPLPNRWKTLIPALLKPRSPEILAESLHRMDGSSAPGEDGIWASCYQTFSDFFVPRMDEVFGDLEGGTPLPKDWMVACVRPIPKKPGAVCPGDQRPIALQQCKTKWIMMTILVQVEDAMAQIVPPQQKAYLKGRRMEDHLYSVMAHWETPPLPGHGEAWIAIDYMKAFDSVNHALVEALLSLIKLPTYMINICLSVMQGDVLFLVGRRLVREVVSRPLSGIRQGDPFSPVIFVLVTSLLLFVKRRDDCLFWLYSDDTLIRVTGPPSELQARVAGVLELVREFGHWSGLRINVAKTEMMLKGVPRDIAWHGIKVVLCVKYLGAFIGDINPDKSFAPAVTKVVARCCWLSTAPLSVEEKKTLIHTWVLPCIRLPALLRSASDSVKQRVSAALRTAMNLKPWRMSLEILSLPPNLGGVGLMKPDIFLDWMLARSFWYWTKDSSFLPPRANACFQDWVRKRGLAVDPVNLPLLVLAGQPKAPDLPWLVHGVMAWSRLMLRMPGVRVPQADLPRLALWHSKLFAVGGSTRASNPIIASRKLLVSDVADLSGACVNLPQGWIKRGFFTPRDHGHYQEALRKVQHAWKHKVGVTRGGPCFDACTMSTPLAMCLTIAQGSKQEIRQPEALWAILQKLPIPGQDKDFIRQALWKKLPVANRLHDIFPHLFQWCPLDFAIEDHHHRLKSCCFLQLPLEILRQCIPAVRKKGVLVELGRLCWDEPLLSLTTPQGLLMWKIIRTLWLFRCAVMFKQEQILQVRFMALLAEGLKWWVGEEILAVPSAMVSHFMQRVTAWIHSSCPLQQLPSHTLPGVKLVRWHRKVVHGMHTPLDTQVQKLGPLASGFQLLVSGLGSSPHNNPLPARKRVFTDGSFAWEAVGVGFAGSGYCVEGDPQLDRSFPLVGEKQTNNRAELFAVIRAAEDLPQEWPLSIVSDSKYVVDGVRRRLGSGSTFGTRGLVQTGTVPNADLWDRLIRSLENRLMPWGLFWTRGHVGVAGNERADTLANQGRQSHPGRLGWLSIRQKGDGSGWLQWDSPAL